MAASGSPLRWRAGARSGCALQQRALQRRVGQRLARPEDGERSELVGDRPLLQPEVQHAPASDEQGVGDEASVASAPVRLRAHQGARARAPALYESPKSRLKL